MSETEWKLQPKTTDCPPRIDMDEFRAVFTDDTIEYLESQPTPEEIETFKDYVQELGYFRMLDIASFVGVLKTEEVIAGFEDSRTRVLNDTSTVAYGDNMPDFSSPIAYAQSVSGFAADWMTCMMDVINSDEKSVWPEHLVSMRVFEGDLYAYFAARDFVLGEAVQTSFDEFDAQNRSRIPAGVNLPVAEGLEE